MVSGIDFVSENLLFYVYSIALQRSRAIVLIGAFESNREYKNIFHDHV